MHSVVFWRDLVDVVQNNLFPICMLKVSERKPLWLYGGLVCVRCETSTQDCREAQMDVHACTPPAGTASVLCA